MSADIHAFRLLPAGDLKKGIQDFMVKHNVQAGWINTCVGSLTAYHIRFANQPEGSRGQGHFEILWLSGTVSINGSHLHIAIADESGRIFGGHLLEGCIIYTTAEIVIGTSNEMVFSREWDATTKWKELKIEKQS